MADRIVLSGDLSEIRLPKLLMSLHRDRETGILSLEGCGQIKTLYIEEGKVVFATSDDPDERLGECLFRRDLITFQQFMEASEGGQLGGRHGEALVDMGALTPEELVEGVIQQLYDIVFSLFKMKAGAYTLNLAPFSTMEMVTLSVDLPLLVFKGMERMDTWSQIYPEVGPLETRVKSVKSLPAFVADLDLTPDQEHVLSLCRQGMTVSSILEASYLTPFQTYRLLWIFLTLGLVVRKAEGGRGPASDRDNPEQLVDQYNDLYAFIYRSLSGLAEERALLEGIVEQLTPSADPFGPALPDLARFGRVDPDAALWALRTLPEGERMGRLQSFLEETLYALVLAADRHLPEGERSAIRAYIQKQAKAYSGGDE